MWSHRFLLVVVRMHRVWRPYWLGCRQQGQMVPLHGLEVPVQSFLPQVVPLHGLNFPVQSFLQVPRLARARCMWLVVGILVV